MTLARHIATNTILSFSTKFLGVILGFFSLGITSRFLGQEGFGVYATALAYAYIVSFIADMGLYSLMVRKISQVDSKEEEIKLTSDIFTLRLISLVGILGIGLGAGFMFSPHLNASFLGFSLAVAQYFFLSISQVLVGIFQKYLQIKFIAGAEIAGRLATLILLFFFASRFGAQDVEARYALALFAFAFGAMVIALLSILWGRRLIPFTLSFHIHAWKKLLRETFPIGISIVLTAVYFKLDTLLLAFFRSPAEVGIYNGAYRILEVMIFFPAAFVGLLMPSLSRFALIDRQMFGKLFYGGMRVLVLVTFPISVGIFFEAPGIIRFLLGEEFLPSIAVLRILAGAMFMIFFGSLFSNALIAKRKQWDLAKIYLAGALVNVAANVFIIPLWGYIGAAFTTLLTEALVSVLMFLSLAGLKTLAPLKSLCIPVVCATLAMSLFLDVTRLPLGVGIMSAGIIYASVLVATGGIRREDIALIIGKHEENTMHP